MKLIAVIWLRFRWEPQRRYMSVSCHVGRTAKNNQKIYFLYRTCSNFNPNPTLPLKEKNKRIRCLEPLSKEDQSIRKRVF